jgi:hypothetical protein
MDAKTLRHRLTIDALKRAVACASLAAYALTGIISPDAFSIPKVEAATGINPIIHYQGKVSSINGAAVANGSYNMRFKIYDAASGGNVLWSENWTNATTRVTMTGGLFSVGLGTHVTMTGSVNFNTDNLYLQIEFDPGNDSVFEEVFSPRRRFASVPYAHNANTLDGLSSEKFLRKDQAETMSGTLTVKPNSASSIGINIISNAGANTVPGLKISTQGANHILFGTGGTTYDVNLYRLTANVLKTDDTFYAPTMSGTTVIATTLLASSGTLVTESGAYFDGTTMVIQAGSNRVGIGTATPRTSLEVLGTASGSMIYASSGISTSGALVVESRTGFRLYDSVQDLGITSNRGGANQISIHDASTDVFLYEGATGQVTIASLAGANILLSPGNGNVGIGTTGPKAKLDVVGTISGSLLVLSKLRNCNLETSATGAVICGTDDGTTYYAGQGLSMNGTTLSLNSTITGSLVRFTTLSGSTVYARNQLVSSGTLVTESGAYFDGGTLYVDASGNRVGIGTTTPGYTLDVFGQIRGTVFNLVGGDAVTDMTMNDALISMRSTMAFRWNNADNMAGAYDVGITRDGTSTLRITNGSTGVGNLRMGIGSGVVIHGGNTLSSSGTLVWEGAASGSTLYVASSINGAGLSDCDATTSALTWDSTTGRFGCDATAGNTYTAGQGLSLSAGNVFTLNSTITGALVRFTTVSGSTVFARNTLTSSGTLLVKSLTKAGSGAATFVPVESQTGAYVYGSGASLLALDSFGPGAGAKHILFGYRGTFDTNLYRSAASRLQTDGSLYVLNTLSGASVHAEKTLSSSGTLVWEGAASGATLYLGGKLEGAGLTDCDLATQTLTWDSTTGRFSCGTDSDTTYTAGQGLTLSSTSFKLNATITGSLVRFLTVSGSTLFARNTLASSGTLLVKSLTKAGSGAATFVPVESQTGAYVYGSGASLLALDSFGPGAGAKHILFGYRGTFDTNLYRSAASRLQTDGSLYVLNTLSGSVVKAQKTLASSGTLVWEGAASGATLYLGGKLEGAGLTDCDLSTQALKWDATTGRFSCGTDSDTTYTAGQGLTLTATSFKLNSTITGSLVRFLTVSGSTVFARNTLASSGTLVVKSLTKAGSGSATFVPAEFQTGAYIWGSGAAALALDGYNTVNGSAQILFGQRGNFDTQLFRCNDQTLCTNSGFYIGPQETPSLARATTRIMGPSYAYTIWRATSSDKEVVTGVDSFGGVMGTYSNDALQLRTNNTNRMVLSGAYVGIGTSAPLAMLHVSLTTAGGLPALDTGTVGLFEATGSAGATSLIQIISGNQGVAALNFGDTDDINIGQIYYSHPNNSMNFTVNNSVLMVMSGSNIGIGTAKPETKLEVVGSMSGRTLTISGTGSAPILQATTQQVALGGTPINSETLLYLGGRQFPSITLETNATGATGGDTLVALIGNRTGLNESLGYFVAYNKANSSTDDVASMRFIRGSTNSAGVMTFLTQPSGGTLTERMRITESGSVGIGTNSVDTALEVAGTMSGRSIYISGTGSSPLLMTNTATGAVGIGTADPKAALHVVSNASRLTTIFERTGVNGLGAAFPFVMRTDAQSVGDFTGLLFEAKDSAGNKQQYGGIRAGIVNPTNTLEDSSLDFITFENGASNVRMVISGSLVGIGTLAPKTKLEVAGSMSGSSLTVSSLRNCNTIDTNANGVLSCGSDESAGTGLDVNTADARYVNTSGDTMTGALVIQNGNTHSATTTPLLNVRGTMSGRSIYISGTGSSPLLMTHTGFGRVGIGTNAPIALLHTFASGSTTGATPGLLVDQGGTGDAALSFRLLGNRQFVMGIDNSDGDKLKISNGSDFGTLDVLTIDVGTDITGRIGIGNVPSPGSKLSVSGAVIINPNGNLGSGAADAGLALEVIGTASGRTIYAQQTLRSSGSLVWEGAASGATIYIGGTIEGAGLSDCDGDTQTLGWDSTAKRFTCGDDDTGGAAGLVDHYVLASGDTMTGALVIQNGTVHSATTTPLLNVRGTMSGRSIYISGTGSSPLLAMNLGKSFVGVGTATPTANLQVVSASTGGVMQLRSYSNSATAGVPSVLSLYSAGGTAASPSATVGTDGGTKPSIWQIKFQGRDNVGDTLSAAEIRATAGCSGCNGVWGAGGHSTALEFYTTPTNSTTLTKAMTIGQDGAINFNVSGFSFPASGTFNPPGNIIMNGGKGVVYTHPAIGTAGFAPDDGAVQAAHMVSESLRFDIDSNNDGTTANYFIVGSDHTLFNTGITSNALMYITGSGNMVIGRSSVTAGKKADLEVIGTASGRIVYAQQALRSSGSLVWEGAASGATLYLGGKLEGAGLTDCDTAASSKLLWDATTGRFSCGTDQTGGGSVTAGQGLALNGSVLTLNGTITGSLVRFTTVSGSTVFAKDLLSSSGTLVTESGAYFDGTTLVIQAGSNKVGIGNAGPADELEISDSSTPALRISAAGSTTSYFRIEDSSSTQAKIQKTCVSGSCVIDLDPLASDGTSAGNVRLFRSTNTTGGAALQIFVGGGSATQNAQIAGTGLSYVSANNGNFGVGTATPKAKLTVAGSGAFTSSISGATLSLNGSGVTTIMNYKVGIGTTNPANKLSVVGQILAVRNDTTGEGGFRLYQAGGTSNIAAFSVQWGSTYPFQLYHREDLDYQKFYFRDSLIFNEGGANLIGGTDIMTLSGARVGIGTLTPDTGLEIIGTASGSKIYSNSIASSGAIVVESLLKTGSGAASFVPAEFQTGAYVYGSGAAALALDTYAASGSKAPNILFGYRGNFDVGMYRFGSNNSGGLAIRTKAARSTNSVFQIESQFGRVDNTVFKVTASGGVYADSKYNSNGADYAEWFRISGAMPQQGEVVCIDVTKKNTVTRCSSDADSNVMGIVSSNPGFVGNVISGADGIIPPGYALIGLIGQVPAKVMVENGEAIRPGDALTPASKAGYARKAKAGESTVGVALEGIEKGEGIVNVLISRRNQSLTVEAVEDKVLKTIADMEIEDEVELMVAGSLQDLNVDQQITDEVSRQIDAITQNQQSIAAINEEIAYLKSEIERIKTQTGTSTTTVITATGSSHLTASTLELDSTLVTGGDARIGGDLSIDGTLNASSLFVPNGLTIDGGVVMKEMLDASVIHVSDEATIDGTLTINGTLNLGSGARLNLGSGALTINELIVENALFVMGDITIQGLATFLGDINVKGELVVSGKQAGFAMIPKSGTSVTVYFGTGFTATPVVAVTPQDFVFTAWRTFPVTQTGFTIELAGPADRDVIFSWIALGVSNPVTITADVAADGTIIFPMATDEIPVSSNMAWNACIRNIPMLDESGQPLSCSRYHDGYTWSHPDLGITFIWNTSLNPVLLKLPDGYKAQVTESADSILQAINGTMEHDGDDTDTTEQTGTGSVTDTGSTITVPAEEEPVIEEEPVQEEIQPVEEQPVTEEETLPVVEEQPVEEPVTVPVEDQPVTEPTTAPETQPQA